MDIDDPLYRADAGPFQKHLERKDGLFHRDGHVTEWFVVGFGVGLTATTAAETPQAVAMPAKAGAADLASRAGHRDFRFGFHIVSRQQPLAVVNENALVK